MQFKDGHFDGTVEADAITVGGTAVLTGGAETAITSILNASLVLGRDADNDIDFGTDNNIIFRAGAADQIKLIDGVLQPVTDSDVDLGTTGVRFKDAFIDTVTTTGSVTVGGDLTITGDDLVMGTNTSGMLLIADGTNFNPTAVGSLSEISTVANDDVFLAVDTSGGGLKKIARSAVVAGLATSGAISNVVEDTTPQLGGNLDMNGSDIVTTSNATIDLAPNGTGTVVVRGNTNPGTIVLNCESNSHGQTIKAQAHSAAVTNTLTLPAGASSTLVSLVSTDTLTNKTLTSPKINEDVAVTSTATELNVLDGITAVVGELNALDIGSTAVGTAVASKAVILDSNKDYTGMRNLTISGEIDAATGDYSGAVDVAGAFTGTTIDASTDFTIGDTVITNGVITDSSGLSIAAAVALGSNTLTTTGAVQTGNIELGHASDTTLARSASGEITIEGSLIKKAGVENIWVPATAMTPRDNAGCADIATVAAGTNGRPDFHVLDFDKDSDEHAQFSIAMPKSWDGGNINAYFYWIGIAATTGVAWGTQVLSLNDNEEIDAAYGTAVVTQDDSQGDVTELLISAKSGDIACGGADGDLLYFQVFRDVSDGNDDMAGDARLVGILFEYTSSASTDG